MFAHNTAEAAVTPVGDWRAFEGRLLRSMEPPVEMTVASPMRIDRHRASHGVGFGVALGMAASVLLFGLAFWMGYHAGARSGVSSPTAVAQPKTSQNTHFARLGASDVNRQIEAFQQVAEVFDRHASWVMTSGSSTDMGLASEPIDGSGPILLLRLAMVRGNDVVSSTDLAIVPGQSANLSVPLQQGRMLHYQIGTTTDLPTRLSLWAEVRTPVGGETLAALATRLDAEPGQAVSAGRLTTAAGVYELQVDFARARSHMTAPQATTHKGQS